MILLPKKLILEAYERRTPRHWCLGPLQAQLGRDPWKIMVASMLLCRTRRCQAEPALDALLREYSGPLALARAKHSDVHSIVRLCGFGDQRARQLIAASERWFSDYEDLRELPGVGLYVADAVGLFCFDCTELACNDHVLQEYADGMAGARR